MHTRSTSYVHVSYSSDIRARKQETDLVHCSYFYRWKRVRYFNTLECPILKQDSGFFVVFNLKKLFLGDLV